MGKLNYDPYIQHFGHPHILELSNNLSVENNSPCSCCLLPPSGWIYTCKHCNFNLHLSCTTMPPLINHPSHLLHSLTLLPTPAYPGALFNCDACGRTGSGFSYHCQNCDFDLHVLCAIKPLSILHQLHPHQLKLTFDPPYETNGFSCDICHRIGSKQWLYRCGACEFDAHLDCATGVPRTQAPPQLQLQHQHSFPGQMNYPQANTNGSGNALVGCVVQGFVDGAAQQAGQNFVQSFTSDGNSGGGGGGGDMNSGVGDPSSLSVISVGTSILSGIFEDPNTQN